MTRVVIETKKTEELLSAAMACPMQCFHKGPEGDVVINPNTCIDCGVCESEVSEGCIVHESEAVAEKIKFNAENSKNWPIFTSEN